MAQTALPVRMTPQGDLFVAAQARQPNTCRWDTVRLVGPLALTTPINFFRIPLGQAGSGFATAKTMAETNMKVAGQLERPVAGTVNQIIVSVMPVNEQGDVITELQAALLEDSILRVTIDEIVQLEDHLLQFGGTGLTGQLNQAAGVATNIVTASPSIRATDKLRPAIVIPSRTTFRVDIIPNTNSSVLTTGLAGSGSELIIRVYLQGVFSRPIDA